jgi:hypothetical protein
MQVPISYLINKLELRCNILFTGQTNYQLKVDIHCLGRSLMCRRPNWKDCGGWLRSTFLNIIDWWLQFMTGMAWICLRIGWGLIWSGTRICDWALQLCIACFSWFWLGGIRHFDWVVFAYGMWLGGIWESEFVIFFQIFVLCRQDSKWSWQLLN